MTLRNKEVKKQNAQEHKRGHYMLTMRTETRSLKEIAFKEFIIFFLATLSFHI